MPYGEIWVEHKYDTAEGSLPYRFTGKELDEETGYYYYGARYLDPRTSRWISTDPAVGEYIPSAPVDDCARERNGNLPGMGGVFNVVNLHVYHYAGNNPIKYIDPNGETTIVNKTKHFLIIRGEDKEAHAIAPDERYDTTKHELESIDGILMPDGTVFKTNNGNKNATFTVSEKKKGGYRVGRGIIGGWNDFFVDFGKIIKNFFSNKKLDLSGHRYKKGDDNEMGKGWWSTDAMEKTEITGEDINNPQSWDRILDKFKQNNPNGYPDYLKKELLILQR